MSDFPFLDSEKSNPYARSIRSEALVAKPIEWLIDNLVAVGSINLFCGNPKAGKTFLLIEMALSASAGTDYLKMPVKRVPVYYCFLEDAPKLVRNRAKLLGAIERLTPNDQFMCLVDYGLDSVQRGIDFLKQEQGLLIIDPIGELSAARNLDENNATDVLNMLKDYRELAHSVNGAIVMSHHFNKGGERMRGSTAFEAGVDSWVNIRRSEKSDVTVMDWTSRMGKGGKIGYEMVQDKDRLKFMLYDANEITSNGYVDSETEENGHFANRLLERLVDKGKAMTMRELKKSFGKKSDAQIEEAIVLLLTTKRIKSNTTKQTVYYEAI